MKNLLIALTLMTFNAEAARFVVEGKGIPTPNELSAFKNLKVEAFSSAKESYFNRTVVVSGNITKEAIEKLSWVKHVEEPVSIMRLSLEPSKNPTQVVEDELFMYQWGLLNEGQVYYREIDDIHNLPMVGTQGSDIGWSDIVNIIPENKVIVAVLDSGVDLDHPELQGNLWKNVNECGKDSSIDNDRNKLSGDCHGWNFTEAPDSPAAKSPQDMEGHGTHVAGIIAAAKNSEGIVGVNPNVLIMPVKVIKDVKSNSEIHSSEALARGIVYATDMGASVINLSLGWPRSLETKMLREAVYYALGQGVVIVSAAGNNNSSEPLFPCAYDGVICAGASTLNGDFAGFSNYGGHVDTVAPGEGILSLHPIIFEPDFFSVSGYDIKSGTSQSSPVVAGLISILRAQDKTITIDEIFARIYSAGAKVSTKKYVMGGEANWKNLSTKVTTSVVRPVLKKVRQIVISGERSDSRLIIPVRNFGVATENISVSISSLSEGVVFDHTEQLIPALKRGEYKDLNFALKVTDMKAESSIKILVKITSDEGELTYPNEIPVVRDIRNDSYVKNYGFIFNNKPLPVGAIEDGAIVPLLSTLDAQSLSPQHEFFMKRNLGEEGSRSIELTVIKKSGNKYVEAAKPILVKNAISIVNFIRVDLNLDGVDDYLVQSVIQENDTKNFMFSFYNSSMSDLWPQFQNIPVVLDTVIRSMNDITFLKINHPKLGVVKVPAFFTEGQIPKVDQVVPRGARFDGGRENRLYYLNPQLDTKSLQIRTLTTNIWKDKIKSSMKSKWFHTVSVEQLLPTSTVDIKSGKLRLFFSVGDITNRKLFIGEVDGDKILVGPALPQIVIQTQNVDSLYSITSNGLEVVGDVYLNVYDRTRARLITTKGQDQVSDYVYRHDTQLDIVAGHLVSFESDDKKFSVLQSREELIAISHLNGKARITKRAKLRYSFLSARTLSEMYNPVIYKRNGKASPALYVDSTSVTANRINLFEEQDGYLVSSIQNSITVPVNCKSLNPYFEPKTGAHEFVFLCFDNAAKAWEIRTLEMK